MNKRVKENKQTLAEFVDRMSAKWFLRTQPSMPEEVEANESTENILRDLIAIPTVTGNYEANHEALDRIGHFLSERGLHIQRYEWNGVESLVATTKRTKSPTVMLFGHIDVVAAPDELFQLQERDGKYYGRGVLDMKGAVAAYLGAVRALGDNVGEYDFGVMLTTDEEVGGFDGAVKLAEAGYRPKVIVLPDGGSGWDMERFAKGIWHVTVEAKGKNAHGSRPWEGTNAIDELMTILQKIRQLFPATQNPETSTINIGIIQGGEAINQIPNSASASMDMRFASTEEQLSIMKAVREIAEHEGAVITSEVEADPMTNDPQNSYLAKYAQCTEEVTGHKVEWIVSNAGNDGRFFSKYGIPCAIAYPTGANHHGPEEFIYKETLLQMQQIFVDYLNAVAKKPAQKQRKSTAKSKVA